MKINSIMFATAINLIFTITYPLLVYKLIVDNGISFYTTIALLGEILLVVQLIIFLVKLKHLLDT